MEEGRLPNREPPAASERPTNACGGRRVLGDPALSMYWNDRNIIRTHGRIPFCLEGALCWEPEGDVASSESVELRTQYRNLEDKPIHENLVEFHRQFELSTYRIDGLLVCQAAGSDAELRATLPTAIEDISLLAGIVSLLCQAGIDWRPARLRRVRIVPGAAVTLGGSQDAVRTEDRIMPVSRYGGEHSWAVVGHQDVEECLRVFEVLRGNTKGRTTLSKALTWFRLSMCQLHPVNRFLLHYVALEALVQAIYESARPKLSSTIEEGLLGTIVASLHAATATDCREIVRTAHGQLFDKTNKQMTREVLRVIFDEHREGDHIRLLELHVDIARNLRGEIAHGAVSDTEIQDINAVRKASNDFRCVVAEVLTRAVDGIEQSLRRTESRE